MHGISGFEPVGLSLLAAQTDKYAMRKYQDQDCDKHEDLSENLIFRT